MPREAARIFLTVKNVWVERVWDITSDNAIKEGFVDLFYGGACVISAKGRFHILWDSIYAKQGRRSWMNGWIANPWVGVTEFQVEEAGQCQDGQG